MANDPQPLCEPAAVLGVPKSLLRQAGWRREKLTHKEPQPKFRHD
jgi:hypothetical protein